jgi:hypothetical protein
MSKLNFHSFATMVMVSLIPNHEDRDFSYFFPEAKKVYLKDWIKDDQPPLFRRKPGPPLGG